MPAFAVGRALDQLPCGSLRRVKLTAADRDAGLPDQLQRANEDLLEPTSLGVDPGRVLAGQEPARRDVLRDPAGAPGAREVSLRDGALRAVEALGSRLEVDPGVVGERQADLAAAFERHDLPQLRDQGAEPVRPARLAPERVVELGARDRAVPVRSEVHEGKPTLAVR